MLKNLTVRWADEHDATSIFNLLCEMHSEIGEFPLSELKVAEHVNDVLSTGKSVVALIDGKIIGSIGLIGAEPWYSRSKIITDDWIFVSPKVPKRLSVFRALMAEVKQYAISVHIPLVISLYSGKENSRKSKLFNRYGKEIMRGFQFMEVGGEYRVQ